MKLKSLLLIVTLLLTACSDTIHIGKSGQTKEDDQGPADLNGVKRAAIVAEMYNVFPLFVYGSIVYGFSDVANRSTDLSLGGDDCEDGGRYDYSGNSSERVGQRTLVFHNCNKLDIPHTLNGKYDSGSIQIDYTDSIIEEYTFSSLKYLPEYEALYFHNDPSDASNANVNKILIDIDGSRAMSIVDEEHPDVAIDEKSDIHNSGDRNAGIDLKVFKYSGPYGSLTSANPQVHFTFIYEYSNLDDAESENFFTEYKVNDGKVYSLKEDRPSIQHDGNGAYSIQVYSPAILHLPTFGYIYFSARNITLCDNGSSRGDIEIWTGNADSNYADVYLKASKDSCDEAAIIVE